jgi:hypothetical protein
MQKDCRMSDKTTIVMNVDISGDNDSYFVRTEIEIRSVTIHGPFPDLQTVQSLKANQLAHRENASEALKECLRHVISTLPGAGSVAS